MSGARPAPERPDPRAFWPAVVVGWAVIGVAVRGLLVDAADTQPLAWLRVFLASALVHDLLLAPLVVLIGWAVARARPAWARPFLQGALICTGAVVLFAYPFVRGFGRQAANPSVLPLDYAAGLATVLGVVWAVALALALLRRWRTP